MAMYAFDFDDVLFLGDDERLRLVIAFVLPLLKFRDDHVSPPRNTSAYDRNLPKVDCSDERNIASAKRFLSPHFKRF